MKKIFNMTLDDEHQGVYAVSMVNTPAFKMNMVKLSEENLLLSVQDKKKQIVTGPLMIPNRLVNRRNKDTEEDYQIYFTEDTIELASQDFLKNFKQKNATVEHALSVDDVTVIESWIVQDNKFDKSTALGMEVPNGSWMVSLKIDDAELWEAVSTTDLLNGLSLEGNFKPVESDELMLSEIKENQTYMNKKENNIIKAIREAFAGEAVELGEVAEVSKWWSEVEGDTYDLNTQLLRKPYEEGGVSNPLNAGEYETPAGKKILVDSEGYIRFIFGDEAEVVEEVVEEPVEETPAEEVVEASEQTPTEETVETPVAEVVAETVEPVVEAPETVAEVLEVIADKEVEEVPTIPHTDTQTRKRVKLEFDPKLTVQERIKRNLDNNLN